MKKFFVSLAACFGCLLFTGCATTSLYSWYGYEEASYEYSKVGTDKQKKDLMKQYTKMLKQTGLRKTVPPGYYAEYGYMLVKDGKTEEGLAFLKKEIELYPESNIYISRIIKQIEK